MKLDSNLVFLILVFAAVFTAGQAAIGLFSVATQKRRVNKRLKVAERVDGVSALVMELRKQRGLNAAGERGKRRARIDGRAVSLTRAFHLGCRQAVGSIRALAQHWLAGPVLDRPGEAAGHVWEPDLAGPEQRVQVFHGAGMAAEQPPRAV